MKGNKDCKHCKGTGFRRVRCGIATCHAGQAGFVPDNFISKDEAAKMVGG